MDVDCDGPDFHCKVSAAQLHVSDGNHSNDEQQGNTDGQKDTNFGALAAYEVPYVVIPDKFQGEHKKELAGNNVVGVIW